MDQTLLPTVPAIDMKTKHTSETDTFNNEIAVLIECTGSNPELDTIRVDNFVTILIEDELVLNAVMSQDIQQEKVSSI